MAGQVRPSRVKNESKHAAATECVTFVVRDLYREPMLDLLGILFSSGIMFLVVLRAIRMDRTQPWFRAPKQGVDNSGLKLRPNRLSQNTRTARRGARKDTSRAP
jgi:hypothetical protein